MTRRTARTHLSLLVLMSVVGCASAPPAPDVTDGITLILRVDDREEDRHALYRVDPDGTIRFAGGRDAEREKYTWSGTLTEDEVRRFNALLTDAAYFHEAPEATGAPASELRTLSVRRGAKRRTWELSGQTPTLASLETLLADAAWRRNASILDALPTADLDERESREAAHE